MVPNTAGGGYDTTARDGGKVMEDDDITKARRGVQPRPAPAARSGSRGPCNEKGNGEPA